MPREKKDYLGKVCSLLIFVPAVLLIFAPSFKLGMVELKTPPFEVPSKMTVGHLFTFPASDEILFPQFSGRPFSRADKPQPLFAGAASFPGEQDFRFIYRAEDKRLSLKVLLPKFSHPKMFAFQKVIYVEPAILSPNTSEAQRQIASVLEGETPEVGLDSSIFLSRTDGSMSLACWKEPSIVKLDSQAPNLIRRRRQIATLAALTAPAPGEVVALQTDESNRRSLVLYHGGGLFTRYTNLKDFRVRRGEKIVPGQPIAVLDHFSRKERAVPEWEIYWGSTQISPENLLVLSSQLCDSK